MWSLLLRGVGGLTQGRRSGEWRLMLWGGFRCRLGWLGMGWVEEVGGWVGTVVLDGLLMMWASGGLSWGCWWIGAGAWGPWM